MAASVAVEVNKMSFPQLDCLPTSPTLVLQDHGWNIMLTFIPKEKSKELVLGLIEQWIRYCPCKWLTKDPTLAGLFQALLKGATFKQSAVTPNTVGIDSKQKKNMFQPLKDKRSSTWAGVTKWLGHLPCMHIPWLTIWFLKHSRTDL